MKRNCLVLAFVFAALQAFAFGGTISGDAHAAVASKTMRIDGSMLSFSSAGAEQLHVELYDAQGRKISDVFNKTYDKGNYSIPLASLVGNTFGKQLVIMKIRKGNEQLDQLCMPAGGRNVLQSRNTRLAAAGTGSRALAAASAPVDLPPDQPPAKSSKVKGKIIDWKNKMPINDVKVSIGIDSTQYTYSHANGDFNFDIDKESLPSGPVFLIFEKQGYVPAARSMQNIQNDTTKIVELYREKPESTNPDDTVLTPAGKRLRSSIYKIQHGHIVDYTGEHIRELDGAGNVVKDFGGGKDFRVGVEERKNISGGLIPTLNGGWICDDSFTNNTGNPTTCFHTDWTVPPAPSTNNGQLIYLFNGSQPTNITGPIIQPVLQWGISPAGGGYYWAVASWSCDHTVNQVSLPVYQVNPGDDLSGWITKTGQNGSNFYYTCQFAGLNNTSINVITPQLKWNCEALEFYYGQVCTDYPASNYLWFSQISITTGAVCPALSWATESWVTDCGQSALALNNRNIDGVIEIRFSNTPALISAAGNPFVSVYSNQQHFVCRDASSGKLWDVWYNGAIGWHFQQLNAGILTSSPGAVGDPSIAVDGTQQHLVYRSSMDGSGRIWHIYNGGSGWYDEPMNLSGGRTNGPATAGNPCIAVINSQQHIVYRDGSSNKCHLYYTGSSWQYEPITAGDPAACDPYMAASGTQQHIVYRNSSGNIFNLYYTTSWQSQNLNQWGAPSATGRPYYYALNASSQHVVYRHIDGTGKILHLFYNGSSWPYEQMNLLGGGKNGPAAAGDPFFSSCGTQQHIVYRDVNNHIQHLYYGGSWQTQDMMTQVGIIPNPPSAAGEPFFSVFGTSQQRITYRDVNNNIQDLWFDGTNWHLQQI